MPDNLSVLIVRLSAIGDVVMTTAATRVLKQYLPDAQVTWVVEPLSAPMLAGNPDIDEIIILQDRSLGSYLRLARQLRQRKFDVVLDFQGLLRSALVTISSGAKRRIGFANGREKSYLVYNERIVCPPKKDGKRCYHSLACYMEFFARLGVSCDAGQAIPRIIITPEEALQAERILNMAGIGVDEPIAAFCPATTHKYKHWTEEGWAQLAENTFNELRIRPVFLGSEADKPLVGRILSMTSVSVVDISGKTTLKQASAVIDRAMLTVSVDTGLLHVSVALGKPTVGVFGPTMAWQNHVHHPHFAVVRKEMECAPCRKKPTCERFDCISDVKPEDVLTAAQKLLSCSQSKGI